MRKSYDEINALKKKNGIDIIWSWSRLNLYQTDKYSYYLKYILKLKEDKPNSIYGASGGICHTIIEKYYGDEIKQEEMLPLYEDELFNLNLAEYKYDRNDSEKNANISNKYETCIKHFFKHHQRPQMNMAQELFILAKMTDKILLQGYVDNVLISSVDGEKKIIIEDFKTSTIYTGKKLMQESGQLVLYTEALRQKTGLPLDRISARYLFLKYVTVDCLQANGKWKERHIERNAIGEKLVSSAKMWLKKSGHNENAVNGFIEDMIITNSLDCLPEEVQEKFVVRDCYVQVPLSEEIIDELKQDIIKTVHEIENKTAEYEKTKSEMIFWQDVTDADSYRLATLSGYSPNVHKPYAEYLAAREEANGGNGTADEDDDFAWLNDL